MERISEYDLDKELASVYSSGQMDQDVVRLALQELKERRAADNKMVENIKKEMVIFCKNFEDRRNHSTICHQPDDNECAMLNFCESIENILEAGATRKENLPVEQLGIKSQLRLVRDRCPKVFSLIASRHCPSEFNLSDAEKCFRGSIAVCKKRCWDKALEGE